MATARPTPTYTVLYFVLVPFLTAPLWIADQYLHYEFLPHLPLSALAVVAPTISAVTCAVAESTWTAPRLILLPKFTLKRDAWVFFWMGVSVIFIPILALLCYLFQVHVLGATDEPWFFAFPDSLVMLVVFFVAGILEEIGWTAYIFDRLTHFVPFPVASLIVGIFWAVWHIISFLQAGDSWIWIMWQCVWTISFRYVLVLSYLVTQNSALPAITLH
ncbi:hypothetical protein HK096_001550, partial [Nowakowskiella sp. JEL0078]